MSMWKCGAGVIFGHGVGTDALATCIASADSQPVRRIDDALIRGYRLPRSMRRADRYARIAAIAALEATKDQGGQDDLPEDTAIIVSGAFGPHRTTFEFLDDLIDYDDEDASPTAFSHSVHSAGALYLAMVLGVHGSCLTLTGFGNPWFQALQAAEDLLESGACEKVVVVGVDELALLTETAAEMSNGPRLGDSVLEGMLPAAPAEGAVALVLSREPDRDEACRITVSPGAPEIWPEAVLTGGVGRSRSDDRVPRPGSSIDLSSRCGEFLFGNGFDTVSAALMLEDCRLWEAVFGAGEPEKGIACVYLDPWSRTTCCLKTE